LKVLAIEEVPAAAAVSDPVYSVVCGRWSDAGLAMLPAAIARVRKFATAYGTDDPGGEDLVKAILGHLATDDPGVILAVFLRGRKVIGHYVVSIDQWMQRRLLTILHFELDEPIPLDRVRAEIDSLEAWGRRHGCSGFQTMTVNDTLARVFKTFYDFRYHATVLRRPFVAEGDTAAITSIAPAEN